MPVQTVLGVRPEVALRAGEVLALGVHGGLVLGEVGPQHRLEGAQRAVEVVLAVVDLESINEFRFLVKVSSEPRKH